MLSSYSAGRKRLCRHLKLLPVTLLFDGSMEPAGKIIDHIKD